MAWSDSIFAAGTPDRAKLSYLARLNQAIYDGDFLAWAGPYASSVVTYASPPATPVKTLVIEGEKVAIVGGTTHAAEYLDQAAGWLTPTVVPGLGAVNSEYLIDAQQIFNFLPNDVRVIAGHSRGGSVAMILGRAMKAAGLPLVGSVSFGAPRPVEAAAVTGVTWQPHIAVIRSDDPVPLLWADGSPIYSWRTPGTHYLLSGKGVMTPYTEQPSSFSQFSAVLAVYGDGGHAARRYAGALASIKTGPSPQVFEGGPNMASVISLDVHGVINEQAVNNTFYFNRAIGGSTMEDIGNYFAVEIWRKWILPRLTVDYSVHKYSLAEIDSVVPVPLPEGEERPNPERTCFRYGDRFERTGLAADAGKQSAPTLPSFVAVSAAKSCSQWARPNGVASFDAWPYVTGSKSPRGGIRFGGIAEAKTDSEGNLINAAEVDAWQVAIKELRVFTVPGGDILHMCVTRLKDEHKQPIVIEEGPPIVYGFDFATVNSLSISPWISSQVSRKQSRSNLG